ncbi:MAG TPA: alpha/beta hydrolase [Thermoanaerobaculia bacterium]|jgi:proline iminopeptidase|nr:alpha/beta hydrolase [Thermoanaerobaculia bacterium]
MRRLLVLALVLALPLSAATFKADDGVVLHYEIVGKGEPIVLLSGGPGFSPEYLRPIADTLGKKYAAVLFHQRGTGKSVLEKYDGDVMELKQLVADLDLLRRELKQEKLILVGHSFGGILSMMYAREHPDRIRALALIDSGGPTLKAVPKFNANLEARFTDEEKARVKEWSDPERRKANPKRAVLEITKAKTPAYFADRTKAQLLIEPMDEQTFNDGVFWAIVMQMMALDLRSGLEKVKAPVIVIHGKQDPLESADEVHATFPGSQLVIVENAGHFPWLEQPEKVYGALDGFLAKQFADCH